MLLGRPATMKYASQILLLLTLITSTVSFDHELEDSPAIQHKTRERVGRLKDTAENVSNGKLSQHQDSNLIKAAHRLAQVRTTLSQKTSQARKLLHHKVLAARLARRDEIEGLKERNSRAIDLSSHSTAARSSKDAMARRRPDQTPPWEKKEPRNPRSGVFVDWASKSKEDSSEEEEEEFQANNKRAAQVPIVPSDAAWGAGDVFNKFDGYTDSRGLLHRTRSRSPFTKPGLWEPNPDDPHSRDPTNKWWYHTRSVGADWLNGQVQWGAHWAVPAAGVGGTDGFSAVHFPTIGTFLGIPDDYD